MDHEESIRYRELFRSIRERRGMHGIPDGTVASIAYVIGCDAATEYHLLDGFASWLNVRRGESGNTSLSWFGELVRLVVGAEAASGSPYWKLAPADSAAVETMLFETLDLFLEERDDLAR